MLKIIFLIIIALNCRVRFRRRGFLIYGRDEDLLLWPAPRDEDLLLRRSYIGFKDLKTLKTLNPRDPNAIKALNRKDPKALKALSPRDLSLVWGGPGGSGRIGLK